jgi:hypothetical protein
VQDVVAFLDWFFYMEVKKKKEHWIGQEAKTGKGEKEKVDCI